VGAGRLGAGTLKDLSLALFIGLTTGTYSSIFIASPILAVLREREPAMIALAKRVSLRTSSPSAASVTVDAKSVTSAEASQINAGSSHKEGRERGPRNQPKRKPRRR
jgi:preprotein translocase subunit SecF